MNKDKSKEKKQPNKKDKDKLREKHRRELEETKIEQEKETARIQRTLLVILVEILKRTGIVNAYEQFLRSICKNGLPEPSNVYEFAAQFVLKYEKKIKERQNKR